MAEGFYQLTYRDLADRLGISPDAARMKANRKAKAGLWRFLPDEAPGQERRVEIPVGDLDDLPERPEAVARGCTAERVAAAEQVETAEQVEMGERVETAERAEAVEHGEAVEQFETGEQVETAERAEPAERIETGERVETAERTDVAEHTAVAEQVETAERTDAAEHAEAPERSAAAEQFEAGERVRADERVAEQAALRSGDEPTPRTDSDEQDEQSGDPLVPALSARVANLTDRLLAEIEARAKDRDALAASEVREEQLKLEIERLCARVSELTAELESTGRPWWQKFTPGGSGHNR
jgi:hypothetical protein